MSEGSDGKGTATSNEATSVQRKSTGKRKSSPTDAPTKDGLGQEATDANEQTSDTVGLPEGKPAGIRQGTRIGRYLVLERLGAGGMGTVYAAYDPELDRKIALKFLFESASHSENARAEVMREGQSMARLSHPNVCSVYDVGDHEDRIFFALEHIEGVTLRKWLKASSPSWKEIVQTLCGAGRGLAAAHAAGIVHRDLKPSNILVDESGKALVTDFGIAALSPDMESERKASVTRAKVADLLDSSDELLPSSQESDTTAGTPPYMSPEQHLGGEIDARSDQFGFCATLYVALYGRLPFPGKELEELRKNILEGVPRPAPAESKVPRWVERVVLRGLQRRPEDRFESMDALLRELSIERRARRRNIVLVGLASVATLALVAWVANQRAVAEARKGFECQGAEERLQETWNPKRAEKAKAKFAEAGASHHADTWQRAEQGLEAYKDEWAAMHVEACTATRVRKELSESMMDLRMSCLDRRKKRLNQLVLAFEEADKKTVTNAVKAVQSLPRISSCGDIEALSRAVPPPEDPEVERQVESVREKVDAVKTLEILGKIDQALEVAKAAASEAEQIDYLPIHAEALFVLAYEHFRSRNIEESETSLARARWAAQASRHDEYAAEAASLSLFIATDLKGDNDEARERAHWAEAAILRYGESDTVVGRYHIGLGTIAHRTGDLQGALEHYTKAAESHRAVHGPDSILVGKSLNNVALAYFKLGQYDEAIAQHQASLAIKRKVLGPKHPDVGYSLSNLGEVYRLQERYELAVENYQQAYEIWEEALGTKHPNVGFPLNNMAEVFLEEGKNEEAIDNFEKALAIWEEALGKDNALCTYPLTGIGEARLRKGEVGEALTLLKRAVEMRESKKGDPAELARTRFAYAQALSAEGPTPEALQLAREAREALRESGEAEKKRLAKVDAWLASQAPQ
jgi:tetratricopeptide (TPR) repeat protein